MKKSKITLTDANVIGLKPKSAKYCVWDQACPGFGVEVTPGKAKLMVAKTCQDGHRTWHTLGTYGVSGSEWTNPATGEPKIRKWTVEDYRLQAMNLKAEVRRGEDPKAAIEARKATSKSKRVAEEEAALARSQRPTVNQLADRFIKDHICAEVTLVRNRRVVTKVGTEESGNRLATAKEHVRLLEKFVRPKIGDMAAADLGTEVVAGLLKEVQDKTPIQANRLRSVLSKMFAKAEIWEYRAPGSNPVRGQERAIEVKRERNLSDKEVLALGLALRDMETPEEGKEPPSRYPLAAIRLPLLTGMRKGEVLNLRWDWIDFDAQTLRIPSPRHKTGKKTMKPRVVLLCEAACTLLKSLPQVLGNPYVIVGRRPLAALVNIQDPWEEVRKAAGLDYRETWMESNAKTWKKATDTEKRDLERMIDEEQVHYHDLRRSFSSLATRMGYAELWISALLGHSAGTVTAGYARADLQDHPLRAAVEAIGSRMAGLLAGTIDLAKEARKAKNTREARH